MRNANVNAERGDQPASTFPFASGILAFRIAAIHIVSITMYCLENPVLQRELLVNLRMLRAFVLLFAYVALLGLVVYVAWPSQRGSI